MTRNSNLAYLEHTEQRQAVEQKSHIKKVSRSSAADYIKPHQVILIVASTVAILFVLIFSMVQLNEVTSQMNQLAEDLRVEQSESVRLNAALESNMSLGSIENYAQNNLGLQKMSPNQVTYISLSQGNAIEIPNENDSGWMNRIKVGISDFLEYLAG